MRRRPPFGIWAALTEAAGGVESARWATWVGRPGPRAREDTDMADHICQKCNAVIAEEGVRSNRGRCGTCRGTVRRPQSFGVSLATAAGACVVAAPLISLVMGTLVLGRSVAEFWSWMAYLCLAGAVVGLAYLARGAKLRRMPAPASLLAPSYLGGGTGALIASVAILPLFLAH